MQRKRGFLQSIALASALFAAAPSPAQPGRIIYETPELTPLCRDIHGMAYDGKEFEKGELWINCAGTDVYRFRLEDGGILDTVTFPGDIASLAYGDGRLYAASKSYWDGIKIDKRVLYTYDVDSRQIVNEFSLDHLNLKEWIVAGLGYVNTGNPDTDFLIVTSLGDWVVYGISKEDGRELFSFPMTWITGLSSDGQCHYVAHPDQFLVNGPRGIEQTDFGGNIISNILPTRDGGEVVYRFFRDVAVVEYPRLETDALCIANGKESEIGESRIQCVEICPCGEAKGDYSLRVRKEAGGDVVLAWKEMERARDYGVHAETNETREYMDRSFDPSEIATTADAEYRDAAARSSGNELVLYRIKPGNCNGWGNFAWP